MVLIHHVAWDIVRKYYQCLYYEHDLYLIPDITRNKMLRVQYTIDFKQPSFPLARS